MPLFDEIENRQLSIPLYDMRCGIVVGVGGVGSWVAFDLAMSGQVEHLIMIDPDLVESSNLNRTPFRVADIGAHKVDVLQYLILQRRALDITTFREKTNPDLIRKIQEILNTEANGDPEVICIIDCRDDVYTDMYHLPGKYYKIGYDGTEITIDGNPKETPVWGDATGYRTIPSFICSAQLGANLEVTDLLTVKEKPKKSDGYQADDHGRLNSVITFDSKDIMRFLSNSNSTTGAK